jgi:hypothetical protein
VFFFFFLPLRTTYRILPSLGGFCCCSPCLWLLMNLWFLTKEWTGLLEGCFIFACCVGKVASCGTTYKNENLDLSMWVLRRNSFNFRVELYSLTPLVVYVERKLATTHFRVRFLCTEGTV